jgi:hypothetical protein
MTELWFRNTLSCLDVCAEEGVNRLTWTRQQLMRYKQDGILIVRQFYMSTSVRPKIMIIGIQGSSEYSVMSKYDEPLGVYPTWSGKNDSIDELYEMAESPWGENERLCSDERTPASLRPVLGQKHRVVIHDNPSSSSGVGKQFWNRLSQIQEDYPDCEFFVNGVKSFGALFGLKFKAGDYGLSDLGDTNQHIILPNGMTVKLNQGELHKLIQWHDWIKVLGFDIKTIIEDQKERYRFRIRAARWASKYWEENYRFHSTGMNVAPDFESSDQTYKPRQGRLVLTTRRFTLADADKLLCGRCRIEPGCKLFRQDSVCGLGDSKVSDLEKFFQTRNAGLIVDGLARLTQLQAQRLENSMEAEQVSGEVSPEVTKQINSLFANGSKLAMLVNPELRGGPRVQVNVGVNGSASVQVQNANPKQIMSDIVAALEHQGIDRDAITPAMIEGVLKSMAEGGDRQKAIEGSVEYARREEMKKAGSSTKSAVAYLKSLDPSKVIEAQPVNVRDEQ